MQEVLAAPAVLLRDNPFLIMRVPSRALSDEFEFQTLD